MTPPVNGWICSYVGRGEHPEVYPINDLREHTIGVGRCWCQFFWEGNILVHNALDGRQEFENGRKMS